MKIKRAIKWTALIVVSLIGIWIFIAYWMSTNDCARYGGNPANPMKAVVSCEYGVENLQLRNLEKPTPADDEILVRIHAASLNPLNGHMIRGGLLGRALFGLRKPKNARFGTDFSGVVEAVGKNVTDFKPDEEVFGAKNGAVADYVCVKSDRAIAAKPSNLSFDQAGSVAVAGLTALQGLRDAGHIHAGQKVLINGASGGIGTFAVQIAKSYGAEVTAVCSTHNLELVKSIGADHVIDYTKEDFTNTNQRYDMIYDLIGNHSFSERRRILTPNGICVLAGIGGAGVRPETWGRIARNFGDAFLSKFTKQKFVNYIAELKKTDLVAIAEMMQAGKVAPVIDRTYKIGDTSAALRYLEEGHARGKVVITLE